MLSLGLANGEVIALGFIMSLAGAATKVVAQRAANRHGSQENGAIAAQLQTAIYH